MSALSPASLNRGLEANFQIPSPSAAAARAANASRSPCQNPDFQLKHA